MFNEVLWVVFTLKMHCMCFTNHHHLHNNWSTLLLPWWCLKNCVAVVIPASYICIILWNMYNNCPLTVKSCMLQGWSMATLAMFASSPVWRCPSLRAPLLVRANPPVTWATCLHGCRDEPQLACTCLPWQPKCWWSVVGMAMKILGKVLTMKQQEGMTVQTTCCCGKSDQEMVM